MEVHTIEFIIEGTNAEQNKIRVIQSKNPRGNPRYGHMKITKCKNQGKEGNVYVCVCV